MKRLYLLIAVFVGFNLTGCSHTGSSNQPGQNKLASATPINQDQIHPANPKILANADPLKNPIAIQVFPKGVTPLHPYKIIASERVSKYNLGGIKRQEACIHDALRNLAASVGGDAVINVSHDNTHVVGTVVAFDKDRH